jgi:tetratricopeptide (TPR) repeat protein
MATTRPFPYHSSGMSAASTPEERAYRGAFHVGTGLILLSMALGIAERVRRDGRLPGLTQDPLYGAEAAGTRGDGPAMRREYRSATAVNRRVPDFLLHTADTQARAGDFAGAEQTLGRAEALNPSSAALFRTRGLVRLWQRRFPESEAAFDLALRADPADALAHAGLGDLWLEQDRYADAEGAFLRALALDPWNSGVNNSLGITYALSGRPAEAVDSFRTALSIKWTAPVQANLERAQAALAGSGAAAAPPR